MLLSFLMIVGVLVVLGLLLYLVLQIPMAEPFPTLIRVVAIVLAVVWVIYELMPMLGGLGAPHRLLR